MPTVRAEDPDPPEAKLTLIGLKLAERPWGEAAAEKVTVPENPFKLARSILDESELPAWTRRALGVATMEKSGVAGAETATVRDTVPVLVLESVTVKPAV